jgi:hypothetical protein
MSYFDHHCLRLKTVVFIALAVLCSLCSKAQSDPGHTFLNISAVGDDDDDTRREDAAIPIDSTRHISGKKFCNEISFDFGTTDLSSTMGGNRIYAHGQSWALAWQGAYKLNSGSNRKQLFLSAGLELRNINDNYAYVTAALGRTQDKLHFWYLGVPIAIQYVNTTHLQGNKNDVNWYLQAGASVGYRVMINHAREDGRDAVEDQDQSYNKLLLQPFFSAGVSYTARGKAYLLGPFLSYSINNLSAVNNTEAQFSTYGLRFSALLLR